MKFETKAIHAGLDIGNPSKSIVPPISPSTIYEINADGKTDGEFHYSRLDNPNRMQFEHLVSALEGGADTAAFASGIAATQAVFQALKPGDEVILPEDVYAGHRKMIHGMMSRWGLKFHFIDMTSLDTIREHITPNTRLIWIETPSNPLMRITDIRRVTELAKSKGILTCVDNTWPTPVNQLPFELGADLVMHSTTKYFGGHSDTMGGTVTTREKSEIFDQIRFIQKMGGAVPSPHDSWMLSRSTRTLSYRMKGHNEHAFALARFLNEHPKVSGVYYPGLESHPGHEIARSQMSGFGGMVSFLIKGSREDAVKVVAGSKIIKRATSLGGVESTWEHRLSTEGEGSLTPETLIRISVGLEHPDDIIEDVAGSLDRI
ncbi:MAG: aminotransferase class I/II-fold pyridoxal phosphate-dependent enzyme [Balneolia bacterium]|nr:aminotransferase class I/II-fold pyridoxal phosphate-dependent enzyme [Balneolia bacterium]